MPIFEADAAVAAKNPLAATSTRSCEARRYAQLSSQICQAGLLDRRVTSYAGRGIATMAALAAGWAAFVVVGDSWWQIAVAAGLAVIFTQVGFLVHDAGHRQICTSRRGNSIIGVPLATLGIGLSYRWWVHDHNRHHAHPNQPGKDPGVDIGALAFTTAQATERGRLARFAYRYQAQFFFPLLLLTALSLHLYSARYLLRRKFKMRTWERTLFAAHFLGYVGALVWVLSPVKAMVFVAVQQGLFGLYVGCSIAPNHKGMAMLDTDDHADYVWRQVVTSRNIRSGRIVDFIFGGLNLQIEHHLFPSMPRSNLRRAQPIIRQFCQEHGLVYTETSLLASYAQALSHLRNVGLSSPADTRSVNP